MYIEGLVFGLLDNASDIPGKRLADKLRNFTIAWSRFGYHDTMLENRSLEGLFAEALRRGYRYCLVQSYGHIIGETWIPEHWDQVDFQTAVQRWIETHEFLVAGTIRAGSDGGFGLDTGCLLVDLQRYEALGRPAFGVAGSPAQDLIRPQPHMDQGADADRFLSLSATDETVSAVPTLDGWGFIQASLAAGLDVYNFDKAIDGSRISLYDPSADKMQAFAAYLDTELGQFSRADSNPQLSQGQRRFLGSIDGQVKQSRNGVFLFNLESYQDVVEQPDAFQTPLTSLYTVAAGFKPNMMLHALGFDENTRMVFFDYSTTALNMRKVIVSDWDGEDFPRFVRYLMQKFPPGEVFYQLWADLSADEIAWGDLEKLWQNEIEKWGGESVIRDHWRAFQGIRHEYVHCNLLTDRRALLEAIDPRPNAAIWWSNAFFTIYSNWLYTADERKAIYDGWLSELVQRNPHIFIYGSDYNNINVNHIRVQEYLDRYLADGGGYLDPLKLSKHEIRL